MSDGPREPGPGGDGAAPREPWEDEARRGHSDQTVRIDRPGQGDLVDAEGPYEEEVTAYRRPGSARPRGPEPETGEGGNRWLSPVLAAVGALLVGLLLGWLVWSGGDGDRDLAAQVDQLSEENTRLQGQVDDLNAQLEELGDGDGPGVEELTAQNEQLTADLEDQRAEVELLTEDNEDLADQVSTLEEANAELTERIEQILDDVDAALVPAPDLVGDTADAAAAQAEENGWVLVQIPTASDGAEPGTVLSQSPPAGTPMLSGSALAIGVASQPEAPPPSDAGTVFESSGTGPGTLDTFVLEGGTRHAVIYSFTGEGRHTVSAVDADGSTVLRLVDVNGTKEGATHIPLTGTYALKVDVGDDVDWQLQVVRLP